MLRSASLLPACSALCLLAFTASAAHAGPGHWDANQDFVLGNSDNVASNTWQYGNTNTQGFSLFSTKLNLYSSYTTSANAWVGQFESQWKTPLVAAQTGWGQDILLLHPSPNSGDETTVRWVAPKSGVYNVSAFFRGLDGGGSQTHTTVDVYHGAASLFTGSANFGQPDATYSGKLTLAAGETLDFGVRGTWLYGSTGFDAQIQAIPEPAFVQMGVMLAGGGLLALRSRRQRTL